MSIAAQAGKSFKVTVSKAVTREAAAKTLERLFMKDKAFRKPIEARTKNFAAKPKRRGGRIWTKWPNKPEIVIGLGATATIPATAQYARDLNSVAEFVDVKTV